MPSTCGPDDCQQSGVCNGHNCLESGYVRPMWDKHFECVYPKCDCPISVMGTNGPLPHTLCPSPCNPYGRDRVWSMPVVSERICG